MRDDTSEDEDTEEGEGNDEHVEVAIVPLADAVADPGTVVIKSLDAIVTQAAVGGARRSEDLAREAELQLHHLVIDDHLLCSRRRAKRRRV